MFRRPTAVAQSVHQAPASGELHRSNVYCMQPWVSDRTVGRFYYGAFNSALSEIAGQGGAHRTSTDNQNLGHLRWNALTLLHIHPRFQGCLARLEHAVRINDEFLGCTRVELRVALGGVVQ